MNRQWILLPALLIIGLLIGYSIAPKKERSNKRFEERTCNREHALINPELDCINTDEKFALISEAEEETREHIDQLLKKGELTRASLFYRDLSTGRWFGVNENESFAPASLLKLPLAIAYHKLAEINPAVLTQSVTLPPKDGSLITMQTIKPDSQVTGGSTHTVAELLELMLINSDNDIFALLGSGIDQEFYNKVNLDLGVHFPTSGGIEQNFVSTKAYAAMLRSLYNSTYLSPENSEQILNMLANTKFDDGLASGLPDKVTIANKFGEREIQSLETIKAKTNYQLHDCGIIYAKDAPYILCIMTEGSDQKRLLKAIGDLSQIVYMRSSSASGSSQQ